MQASSCTPLAFKSSACCTNPGRWVWNQQGKVVNHGKTINAQVDVAMQTFEQPGVKAPGTAKRTPFFPLKSWSIETLFPGSPSWTSTAGRGSPTCVTDFEKNKSAGEKKILLTTPHHLQNVALKQNILSTNLLRIHRQKFTVGRNSICMHKSNTLIYLHLSITKSLVVSLFHHVSHRRGSEYSILQYCKYFFKENPLLHHLRFFEFLNSKKGTIVTFIYPEFFLSQVIISWKLLIPRVDLPGHHGLLGVTDCETFW